MSATDYSKWDHIEVNKMSHSLTTKCVSCVNKANDATQLAFLVATDCLGLGSLTQSLSVSVCQCQSVSVSLCLLLLVAVCTPHAEYCIPGLDIGLVGPVARAEYCIPGLDIGLVGPVARGASRFEKLLAPPNNLLAPQKTNWSLPQNQTCATKKYLRKPTICT